MYIKIILLICACCVIGVVDVKLAQEEQCMRMGLRSSGPLRIVAIYTIDIFIRGSYL